jgi:monoamine oxidase
LNERAEVVVVGAGFAGVAAARELGRCGVEAVVLEARDRVGGRTWFDRRLGTSLELGGTWVHPAQPMVWAEIQRLGLRVVESPEVREAVWLDRNGLHQGTVDELWDPLDEPMRRFAADARQVFPRPFEPLAERERLAALDGLTVDDRLVELDLPGGLLDQARAVWGLHFSAPPQEGGLTQALRWLALAGGDWLALAEACETFRLADGTSSLLEAIAAELPFEVRLGRTVTEVEEAGAGAVVRLADGSSIECRAVIVTVPPGALGRIRFEPGLPDRVAAFLAAGQASRGLKFWVRLREPRPGFCALAPSPQPINWLRSERGDPEGTLLVGFSAERHFDPSDRDAVERAVRTLLPDAGVVAATGHDWVGDDLAGETWTMLRPGQLTEALPAVWESTGPIRLAGSYAAHGWAGFIDGALESGMRVARAVAAE